MIRSRVENIVRFYLPRASLHQSIVPVHFFSYGDGYYPVRKGNKKYPVKQRPISLNRGVLNSLFNKIMIYYRLNCTGFKKAGSNKLYKVWPKLR